MRQYISDTDTDTDTDDGDTWNFMKKVPTATWGLISGIDR